MAFSPIGSKIIRQLIDTGVIPSECVQFTLSSKVSDVVRMTYEILVSEAQFQAIADAIRDNPEEAQRIARTFVFRSRDGDSTAEVIADQTLAQGGRLADAAGKT